MRTRSIAFCMAAVLFVTAGNMAYVFAENGKKNSAKSEKALAQTREVDSLLASRGFMFIPEKAYTRLAGNKEVIIRSHYEFIVTPDSIISSLPYYGKAYSNKYDRLDQLSPLDFESDDFSYEQSGRAVGKEKAVITIATNSATSGLHYKFRLEVFDNKAAVLTVDSPAATDITFRGNIVPLHADR